MRKINVKGSTMGKIKVTYKVGNNTLKPARKIEIGQWWLYRDSKKWDWPDIPDNIDSLKAGLDYVVDEICAVVVVDIIPGVFGGQEVKVEFMLAEPKFSPFDRGDVAWFIDQNFDATEGYLTPFWDPNDGIVYKKTAKPTAKQYGVDCTKCKRYYNYAARVAGFECWSCRNGY